MVINDAIIKVLAQEHFKGTMPDDLCAYLFDRYDQIEFEADDTDWAATAVKDMFLTKNDRSFDTYVYLNQPCGYDKL